MAIFGKDGTLEETWSKAFAEEVDYDSPDRVAQTAHGLYWSKEPAGEFLYWTENVAGPKGGRGSEPGYTRPTSTGKSCTPSGTMSRRRRRPSRCR